MFNLLESIQNLSLILLLSFFFILLFRCLYVKRTIYIVFYHGFLGLILLVLTLGGGGVLNEGYKRLDKFRHLEKNNQLTYAKNHFQDYGGMFQIDLKQFENSRAFEEYLQGHGFALDKIAASFIGWLFAFLAELSIAGVGLLLYVVKKFKKQILAIE